MKKINSISESFVVLDPNDLMLINGGTIKESYDAGYKVGQYLRQLWDSWGVVKWLFT